MALAGAVAGLALSSAGAADSAATTDACRPATPQAEAALRGRKAVVTDIDGVLGRYILLDYGPTNGAFLDRGITYPREDAALLMNIYHRRGYLIVYMAGRPRQMQVMGRSMCQATLDWLAAEGFPTEPGNTLLLLRDGAPEVTGAENPGAAMGAWMGAHGSDLFVSMLQGVMDRHDVAPVYGYVDSGVVADAYLAVGVAPADIFTIGNKGVPRLGYRGTTPIFGADPNIGFARHVRDFVVPQVPRADR